MSSSNHTIICCDNKTLYGWGDNEHSQLGSTVLATREFSPSFVMSNSSVQSIACGENHSVVSLGGTLFSWGANQYGQLGLSNTTNNPKPQKIHGLSKVTQVSCGWNHTLALSSDGSLYSWGFNNYGQLGLSSSKTFLSTPSRLEDLPVPCEEALCGAYHCLAVTSSRDLYTWGLNEYGQLGHSFPKNRSSPHPIPALSGRVSQVACGIYHSLALLDDGSLYSWGHNIHGQLGLAHTAHQPTPQKVPGIPGRILQIACGGFHSMVITEDGSLYSWGKNEYGQLGIRNTGDISVPRRVTGFDGKIAEVAAGKNHTVVVTKKGVLYSWGFNFYGQLGISTSSRVVVRKPWRVGLFEGMEASFMGARRITKEMLIAYWPQYHFHLPEEIQNLLTTFMLSMKSYNPDFPKDFLTLTSKTVLYYLLFSSSILKNKRK